MKSWLLYFFAIVIALFSVAFSANYIYADYKIPTLSILEKDKLTEISVEEYALRVLLAESQSCTDMECKKALAVSARSAGLYLAVFGQNHKDFDACTKGDCCILLGSSEEVTQEVLAECKQAVEETKGMALFYNGLPAMALFCLCGGDFSGNCPQYTYLTAVENKYACEIHTKTQIHPYSALTPLLLKEIDYGRADENSLLVYGGDKKCEFGIIAGKKLSAAQIQSALSLNSPQFGLKFTAEGIQSTSAGVGHGYGMSICHGNKMAAEGWSYQRILEHFYPNLVLKNLCYN